MLGLWLFTGDGGGFGVSGVELSTGMFCRSSLEALLLLRSARSKTATRSPCLAMSRLSPAHAIALESQCSL